MFRVRIRQLREDHGFSSQKSFADAFGVAQTTVASWEGGKREPNYTTTIRLADFFGVSLDYHLLGRTLAPAPARSADSILTPADQELVELYHRASGDDRTIVDMALKKYKIPSRAEQVG